LNGFNDYALQCSVPLRLQCFQLQSVSMPQVLSISPSLSDPACFVAWNPDVTAIVTRDRSSQTKVVGRQRVPFLHSPNHRQFTCPDSDSPDSVEYADYSFVVFQVSPRYKVSARAPVLPIVFHLRMLSLRQRVLTRKSSILCL